MVRPGTVKRGNAELRKVQYAEMLLHEFREALERQPTAYVPIGPLEWHGDHLPLGTDPLRAAHMCERLARELGGIVLPVWYVSCRGYSSFEGTVVFRHETAVNATLELLAQLEKVSFRAAVLLSAHGGNWQKAFIEEVEASYSGAMSVLGLFPRMATQRGDHAGTSETSEMLAARPDLVALERFQFPENPVRQYAIDPADLCPAETRPWIWKEDVRKTASSALGRENHDRVVAYVARWLKEKGLLPEP